MTLTLFRKLFRDARTGLLVVGVMLFLFSMLWVKVAQRVTTEISPFFAIISKSSLIDPKIIDEVLFKGPGKVSQAVLGGADVRFERPADFLAVGMLHPVVLILAGVWSVGRAAGAVAGELDRGTMELLLSQPVPRNRLILAHLLVDLVAIPALALCVFAGTRAGLALVGPFVVDYSAMPKLPIKVPIPATPEVLPTGEWRDQLAALTNLAALMFALSGLTLALSAAGRSRWKVIGYGVLTALVMFAANVLGQLWDAVAFVRPATVFYYYQPQRIMLRGEWLADLGEVWNGGAPLLPVSGVAVLLAVGVAGYAVALRVFTRRDLPAPL